MSFFRNKLGGKTRARANTDHAVRPPTKHQLGTKEMLERDYASVTNSQTRSQSNFRPVQHHTVAQLDSFFGGTGAQGGHSRVKEAGTGHVWYDTLEQQEWRKLLSNSGGAASPGTPASRRSSSTSFLAGWSPSPAAHSSCQLQQRRRSIHTGARTPSEAAMGLATTTAAGAPLSPLSELIDCYAHSPFIGPNMLPTTPRTPSAPHGPPPPFFVQAILAGMSAHGASATSPITLDLAGTSPFYEHEQHRPTQRRRRGNSRASICGGLISTHTDIGSGTSSPSSLARSSGRTLRTVLGLASPSASALSPASSGDTTPSPSGIKESAGTTFAKKIGIVSESSSTKYADGTLRSPCEAISIKHGADQPEGVVVPVLGTQPTAVPLIQPPPSRAERSARARTRLRRGRPSKPSQPQEEEAEGRPSTASTTPSVSTWTSSSASISASTSTSVTQTTSDCGSTSRSAPTPRLSTEDMLVQTTRAAQRRLLDVDAGASIQASASASASAPGPRPHRPISPSPSHFSTHSQASSSNAYLSASSSTASSLSTASAASSQLSLPLSNDASSTYAGASKPARPPRRRPTMASMATHTSTAATSMDKSSRRMEPESGASTALPLFQRPFARLAP